MYKKNENWMTEILTNVPEDGTVVRKELLSLNVYVQRNDPTITSANTRLAGAFTWHDLKKAHKWRFS